MDVAGLNVGEVLVEHLGHGGAGDVGAFLGQPTVGQIATCMLGVAEVDVGDDVDDASVGLLGEALVLATVAGLHVENGDVKALGGDCREAGVGVAKDEQGVGVDGGHELVGAIDDVAHGGSEVVAHGIHVDLGVGELEVAEEDAIEVVVIVLPGVGQDDVKIFAALVDGRREANNLGAGADDDEEFQLAVFGKTYVAVISFHECSLYQRMYRGVRGQTARCSTSRSRGRECRRG